MHKKNISILGSTGSIGVSSLDICRQHSERFNVVALAAGRQMDVLLKQIVEFKPRLVSVYSETEYNQIKTKVPATTTVVYGTDGNISVATADEADLVISAIVGAAGLLPTLAAIEAKKEIGLANKESMVIAGEIMSARALANNVRVLPIDSEHSAIFQCLQGETIDDVENLILTASGGPFLNTKPADFVNITKVQALKHPNWDMGAKITIDSATMMNKGLEVIEASWLFNMPIQKIKVVVHPQSIIHSMVEYVDGSVISQMGEPDMRVPIAYALSYPRRISTNVKKLDFSERDQLLFHEPDLQKFHCLKLAFDVAKNGQSYAPVLNAANEVAVAAFLDDKIKFVQIPDLIDECLNAHQAQPLKVLEDVLAADRWARNFVMSKVLDQKSKVVA